MTSEKQVLDKARKYLLANGYESSDFFVTKVERTNNVRCRAQAEENQNQFDAKPQVRVVVGDAHAGQDGGSR